MDNNIKGSLDKLLLEITPEEQAITDAKMQLAAKIADAMFAKGWNKTELMRAIGKRNPSEITRWLSGTHNFTVETLIDLGRVLDTKFINFEDNKPPVQQFHISVKSYSTQSCLTSTVVNDLNESYSSYNQTFYS